MIESPVMVVFLVDDEVICSDTKASPTHTIVGF